MLLKKFATVAALGVSTLALSGCLTLPGEFTSEAVINADGSYMFSYSGDVQIVTLAMMMAEAKKSELNREFTPYCYGPEGSSMGGYAEASVATIDIPPPPREGADAAMEGAEAAMEAADAAADYDPENDSYAERPCTKEEIASQRAEFDANIAREKEEAKEMQAMLGGIDPTNPDTLADFTDRLERQRGWESVKWVRGGTFRVVYKTSGMLNDNFGFPLIADVPTGQPFLTITRWDDNAVQISAPGFVGGQSSMGDPGMLAMTGMFGGGKAGPGKEMEKMGITPIKGSFTVRTNGTIRTNNTDKGPVTEGGMQVLRWKIDARSASEAPKTLIQL